MRASRFLFASALLVAVAAFAVPAPADGQSVTASHQSVAAPADGTCGVAAESQYVRLRGSPEIHLRTCEKVKRADPEGILPANKDDGPPCYYCRRSEIR
jgi:hypothetical protein